MDSFTTSSSTEKPDAFQTFGSYDNDRNAYLKNPLSRSHLEKGDFTPFYVTITICTLIGFALILLNVFFCWCSKHKYYWQDPNTGNRWILPIWTQTPYKQPPLDLTELEAVAANHASTRVVYETSEIPEHPDSQYIELHKRESDL
ncbi:hypothetical protein GE061_018792 [Apolygus lucorum]|uniref:Uncharacterized protein n=1 Tax=Apolygus lucorum TaxID=248454 RepID=A0A6A4J8H5_APOLU|nr:hypothetical protein GE061_018792 [Apolygus lucorum]